MILALNTAQKVHEMALIKEGLILKQESWIAEKNTLDNVVPMLKQMLTDASLTQKDLTAVAVVQGPGPFSGLRTGIAFANAFSDALNIPLHSINTFSLLRLKTGLPEPLLVVLNAGGLDVGVLHGHEVKVGPLSSLLSAFPHGDFHVIFEGTETQAEELRGICLEKKWKLIPYEDLQSMADVIVNSGLEPFSFTKNCEPYYLKGPHITPSSDPWKKP